MKRLITIQNKDNPVNKCWKGFAKQFLGHKKDYSKIKKKQNNISINVFGFEDESPFRTYTSKVFKNFLIYYYHKFLKIPIMFWLNILIHLWLRKQSISIRNIFVNVAYDDFLAQEYQNVM